MTEWRAASCPMRISSVHSHLRQVLAHLLLLRPCWCCLCCSLDTAATRTAETCQRWQCCILRRTQTVPCWR